jgi:hypothetical protein
LKIIKILLPKIIKIDKNINPLKLNNLDDLKDKKI